MSKRAPSTVQLAVITAFALSCFGILLFLWVTFGGSTPFKAKSYQIKVPFTEASQLAEQSDVRISGVDVGKVESIELGPGGKEAIALLNIDDKYAPLPRKTRAMLRTKTLLGETYVELSPGNKNEPTLPEDSTLPTAQVAESVQLDEIFQAFDPKTREAFQDWMQEAAVAIEGQGQNLSYAIGNFDPTFTEFENLFRVLNSQKLAVSKLFSNGAKTFEALRGREGELANLIRSSNELFKTTGERNEDIEALFRAFPTFQDESRLTVDRLRGFAVNADPLSKQLVPVAEELSPTLIKFGELAPEAKKLFEALPAVEKEAPTGFPALRKLFRDDFPPLLRATEPFVRNLEPGGHRPRPLQARVRGRRSATSPPPSTAQLAKENEAGRKAPLPARDRADPERIPGHLSEPPDLEPQQPLQPARLGRPARQGRPAGLRHPPMHGGRVGDARPRHRQPSEAFLERTPANSSNTTPKPTKKKRSR